MNRELFWKPRALGGGDGGYTPVNDPTTLPFIGENTRVEKGPMLGGKGQKVWPDEKLTRINNNQYPF